MIRRVLRRALLLLGIALASCELAFPVEQSSEAAGQSGAAGRDASFDVAPDGPDASFWGGGVNCGSTRCLGVVCCVHPGTSPSYDCKAPTENCAGLRCDEPADCPSADGATQVCCASPDGTASYCLATCYASATVEICNPLAPSPCSKPAQTCLPVGSGSALPPGYYSCQ